MHALLYRPGADRVRVGLRADCGQENKKVPKWCQITNLKARVFLCNASSKPFFSFLLLLLLLLLLLSFFLLLLLLLSAASFSVSPVPAIESCCDVLDYVSSHVDMYSASMTMP